MYIDNGKIKTNKEMTYLEFIKRCDNYLNTNVIHGCEECHGGIKSVFCCRGYHCACLGKPVDFESCPNGCTTPYWFK